MKRTVSSNKDTVYISDDARFAAMMSETDEQGCPLVKWYEGNDCVTGSLISITLGVMAMAIAVFGFLCWITGSIRGAVFVTSLLLIIGTLIYAWNDSPNNGEVKL